MLTALQGGAVGQFRHGTTVGTNAIIQRNGACTGLITTTSFRDVLLAERASRPDLYDSDWDPPPPLVPRSAIFTVEERMDYRGEVVPPLAEDEVRETARALGARGVQAAAICFINSFVNPDHERRALAIVREQLPGVYSCASNAIVPEIREFERTSTTVVNAYLGPLLATYLARLDEILSGHALQGGVLVTHSGGGLIAHRRQAARLRACGSRGWPPASWVALPSRAASAGTTSSPSTWGERAPTSRSSSTARRSCAPSGTRSSTFRSRSRRLTS